MVESHSKRVQRGCYPGVTCMMVHLHGHCIAAASLDGQGPCIPMRLGMYKGMFLCRCKKPGEGILLPLCCYAGSQREWETT